MLLETHYKSREALRNAVIEVFAAQPEINQVFLFGREVENLHDDYSDLDVIVCSNDLAKTQAAYRDLFTSISPVIGTFLIETSAENLSEMVMLHDYAPYQKIDFSIVNEIEYKIQRGFGPFLRVHDKQPAQVSSRTQLEPVPVDAIRNQLHDFLFSVPRFTKCLFRQDMDMYRRWKNISNITLVMLYEKYEGWTQDAVSGRLPGRETHLLEERVNPRERDVLDAIFPTSGQLNLARSYQHCIHLLIDLSRQKAARFDVAIDEGFIDYMRQFLDSEIDRFLRSPEP